MLADHDGVLGYHELREVSKRSSQIGIVIRWIDPLWIDYVLGNWRSKSVVATLIRVCDALSTSNTWRSRVDKIATVILQTMVSILVAFCQQLDDVMAYSLFEFRQPVSLPNL